MIVEDNLVRFLRTDYDIATVQRKIYDNPNIPDSSEWCIVPALDTDR